MGGVRFVPGLCGESGFRVELQDGRTGGRANAQQRTWGIPRVIIGEGGEGAVG